MQVGADVASLKAAATSLSAIAKQLATGAQNLPTSVPQAAWTGDGTEIIAKALGSLASNFRLAASSLQSSAGTLQSLANEIEPLAARWQSLQQQEQHFTVHSLADGSLESPSVEMSSTEDLMSQARQRAAKLINVDANQAVSVDPRVGAIGTANQHPQSVVDRTAHFLQQSGAEIAGGIAVAGGAVLVVGSVVLTFGTDGVGVETVPAAGALEEQLVQDETNTIEQAGPSISDIAGLSGDNSLTATGSLEIVGEKFSASEIQVANTLAENGYNVVLRVNNTGAPLSDLVLNGEDYEIYTPETSNAENIIQKAALKARQVSGGGVVIDLTQTSVTASDIPQILSDIQTMTSQVSHVILIDNGEIMMSQ